MRAHLAVPLRRRMTRRRHGDHHVGLDRMLEREPSGPSRDGPRARCVPATGSRDVRGRRTRRCRGSAWATRRTARACRPRSSIRTSSPGSTSRIERRADDVERARLRGDDEAVRQAPDRQRTHPVWIAGGEHAALVHEDEAVGAPQRRQDPHRGLLEAAGRPVPRSRSRSSRGRCRWSRRSIGAEQLGELRACSRGCRCDRGPRSARRRS